MSQDIIKATMTILSAEDTVSSLAGDFVFGGAIPKSAAADMPRHALSIQRASGFGGRNSFLQLEDSMIKLRCYGITEHAADQLYRACRDVLKQAPRQIVEGFLVHGYEIAGSPFPLTDPDTHWPYVLSNWSLLAAEQQAT